MKKAYKLTPAVKDIIWGGRRLIDMGKVTSSDRIAESWELSFTKGGVATADGIPLTELFPRETWGTACRDFPDFPVLTKFIDAGDKLSVQVHPSDEYALKNEGEFGKTEMWYVVSAEEGAGLYMGLRRECSTDEFATAVATGRVEELLSFTPVLEGDVFFIPAGTIHAIGAGVMIYEIQQNSTLTYRLYDYMRRDKNGNLRELHVERAMKVSELKPYEKKGVSDDGEIIGSCEYFETRELSVTDELTLNVEEDSYLLISVMSGSGKIENETASRGDSFFMPAKTGKIKLTGDMKIITVKTP